MSTMTIKFNQKRTKHELYHLFISLAAVLICIIYLLFRRNWLHIGSFWESMTIPIVFIGEMLKVILARFYGRQDDVEDHENQCRKYFSFREVLGGLMLQIFCTLIYAFVCIILGAPLLHSYERTFMLSLLLTLLTVSPAVFLLGGDGALQLCFCAKPNFVTKTEHTALKLFKYNALGSIVGAWVGTIVVPLDWDRDWQVYPIPNMIGALLGSTLCNIYACIRVLYTMANVYKRKVRS